MNRYSNGAGASHVILCRDKKGRRVIRLTSFADFEGTADLLLAFFFVGCVNAVIGGILLSTNLCWSIFWSTLVIALIMWFMSDPDILPFAQDLGCMLLLPWAYSLCRQSCLRLHNILASRQTDTGHPSFHLGWIPFCLLEANGGSHKMIPIPLDPVVWLSRLVICTIFVAVALGSRLRRYLLSFGRGSSMDQRDALLAEALELLQEHTSWFDLSWLAFPLWSIHFNPFDYGSSVLSVSLQPPTKLYNPMEYPDAGFSEEHNLNIGWRVRRHFRNVAKKIARREARLAENCHLSATITSPTDDSSVIEPMQMSPFSSRCYLDVITDFVRVFNPASVGKRILAAERLEKDKLRVITKRRKVSVDLRRCKQSLLSFMLDWSVFPAMTETVLNSISTPDKIPLIMDTGASCCISPCKDDFIEYRPSSVRITDLSNTNRVAGEGLLRWKVLDADGKTHVIDIKGYHVPNASVRLLSPQCLLQLDKAGEAKQDIHKF
jgi:hypothetical protein